MKIIYKTTLNDKFTTNEDYFLQVNLNEKLIEWSIYAHPPKDMHWKAADQYGLGAEHHLKTQSFKEFYTNPSYEIDPVKKKFIDLLIKDSKNIKETVAQMKSLAISNDIILTKDDYTTMVLYTIKIDDLSFKINCKVNEDITTIDFLNHFL